MRCFTESVVEEGALCVYPDMKPDIMSGCAASGRKHSSARDRDSNPDKVSGCVVVRSRKRRVPPNISPKWRNSYLCVNRRCRG